MDYSIEYYSDSVAEEIIALPDTLAARYVVLTRRVVAVGPNLGAPHTEAFGDGLFELRLKGSGRDCQGLFLRTRQAPSDGVAFLPQEDPEDTPARD